MYEYKITLDKVVDGDTVDVNIDLGFDVWLSKQRIRLQGIDAPESRTRDLTEKQFGLLAKRKVIEFFEKEGEYVLICDKYDASGKFGRILGDVECDGISLCSYLLENNYVVPYNGQSKDEIEDIHISNRKIIVERGEITIN